jgi:membrane protein
MKLASLCRLVKDAAVRWSDDECYRRGAALSFYAVFSMFPLLLLCITGFGFVMGRHAGARDWLLDYVSKSGVSEIRPILDETLTSMQAHATARGVGAVVGAATLLFGASGVFSELEASLNLIWRVRASQDRSVWRIVLVAVESKALSFLVVIGTALALSLSLLMSLALRAVDGAGSTLVRSPTLWLGVDAGVSIVLLTCVFSAVYRMIPRTASTWGDVFGGALVAAVLLAGLKHAMAWYLGHVGSYAAYGAVGGMLALLTWIYLASLVLFLGAEFARIYAERYGSLAGLPAAASPLPLAPGSRDESVTRGARAEGATPCSGTRTPR